MKQMVVGQVSDIKTNYQDTAKTYDGYRWAHMHVEHAHAVCNRSAEAGIACHLHAVHWMHIMGVLGLQPRKLVLYCPGTFEPCMHSGVIMPSHVLGPCRYIASMALYGISILFVGLVLSASMANYHFGTNISTLLLCKGSLTWCTNHTGRADRICAHLLPFDVVSNRPS